MTCDLSALLENTEPLPDAAGLPAELALPVVVHGTCSGSTWFVIAVVPKQYHAGVRCLLVCNLEATSAVAATLARVRVPASILSI